MFKFSKKNKTTENADDKIIQHAAKTSYLTDNRNEQVNHMQQSKASGDTVQLSKKKKDADKEMAKSMANVKAYSSLADAYDEDDIKEAITATGHVKGHHSGKAGDGMNAATQKGLSAVAEHLKASKDKEKVKPAKVYKEAPKGDFEKAMIQATSTYKGNQEKFDEYIKARGYEFSDEQLDDLYDALNK